MKLQISDPYGKNWESKLCRWKCYILNFLLNEKKIQVNLRRSVPLTLQRSAFRGIFWHLSCGDQCIFTKLGDIIDPAKRQIHYIWALSHIWISPDICQIHFPDPDRNSGKLHFGLQVCRFLCSSLGHKFNVPVYCWTDAGNRPHRSSKSTVTSRGLAARWRNTRERQHDAH